MLTLDKAEGFILKFGVNSLRKWWPLPDLNRGPTDYESGALTN